MSSSKEKEYLGELYNEEGEKLSDVWELCHEELMLDDSDDEMKPELRSTPTPDWEVECQGAAGGSRDRSRSPIWSLKPEDTSDPKPSSSLDFTVPKWINGDDELTNDPIDDDDLPDDDVGEDQTLTSGPHASLTKSSDKREINADASQGEGNVRTGVRSRLKEPESQVRRHERAQNCSRKGDKRSGIGQPLQEIWTRDEDIPSELRDSDVVRQREVARDRAQESSSNETGNQLLEGENLLFEWFPIDTFQPKEELFTPERTGSVQRHWSPYDAFRSIWDDSVLEQIAHSTNQYASTIKSSFFQKDWYPTTTHEVMCLFAFWIMLGIVRMPTITSCFSTDPLLRTEIFRKIFTCQRYTLLTRALNFANTANLTSTAACSDVLYPLRPIITSLNAKFQENYVLSKDICIAESLTHWKGKLDITKQYNPSKAEYGIKTVELCESVTGYLWSFMVYTGKQKSTEILKKMVDICIAESLTHWKGKLDITKQYNPSKAEYGIKTVELCESVTGYLWSFMVYTGKQKSTEILKKMVEPLFNKGYRLFMDNWENSLVLARFLKRNGTDCIGTLQPQGQGVPVYIHQAPLKRGQFIARHTGDICVLSFYDNKLITIISTCHGAAAGLPRVPSKPRFRSVTFKPQVVLDYERSMGGVDLKDQMLEPYLLDRKSCWKWYMKSFKRLLNVSISNARILMESSLQCPQDHHNFRLRLVDMILDNHLSQCPQPRRHAAPVARLPDPMRKVPHIHWPVRVEDALGYTSRNRKTRVRCSVCIREGRKTVKTCFKCEACNVPLCVEGCFKKYHVS